MKTARLTLILFVIFIALVEARAAQAACDTSGTKKAWGDFWIERSGVNCDCDLKMTQYTCQAAGTPSTVVQTSVIATVSGACDTACEDLAGYDDAVATAIGKWAASTGNYECDSTFVDADQDGYGSCIDANDANPRVWVKTSGINETVCDGVDNDSDGTADDSFSVCASDQKRLSAASYQGDGSGRAHLISGSLHRSEVDLSVQGPYGPLVFARSYSSGRSTNDAELGIGWTHNFAVYLKEMPSGDGRWQVQTPSGEMQYFRCSGTSNDKSCAIDDHRPRGNLRRISSLWYFYPGDGTRYEFDDTEKNGRRAYATHLDEGGFILSKATTDSSGRITKVESANGSIYLYFEYGTDGLDKIRINSTSTQQALDYDVVDSSGTKLLDKVKWASALGTIDADILADYTYDATSKLMTKVEQKLDASTTLTVASFSHDGSKRVTSIKDASKDLGISYGSADTTVTYTVKEGTSSSTKFLHNGLWVTGRDAVIQMGGIERTIVRDEHGRMTCAKGDDSVMTKLDYTDSWLPVRVARYDDAGSCSSGGTVQHKTWTSWAYNTARQSWRQVWVRQKSTYNPATDCTGATLPSGCTETKYEYVSSTDDRVQWITTTGYTKLVDNTTPQQISKQRIFYFGLDTSVCTSGDSYTGLPCRVEVQNTSGTVFRRTDFTYVASGATAGLLEAVKRHDKTSDPAPLTTTYASHNAFGSPTSVTDEAGVVSSITYNGWNAATEVTVTDALLDEALPPAKLDPVTRYTYNKLREISEIELPKGNKRIYKYFTTSTGYARLKAMANADSSGNLLEIMRYEYDNLGNQTEEKIIDSITGSDPCADEDCTILEVRRQTAFDALGRVTSDYLHAANTSDPADATASHTYDSSGRISLHGDFLGKNTEYTYDSRGRLSTTNGDDGGIDATTTFTYDVHDRVLETTGPNGVVTRTELDDFGQLVLERSKTRGDMRYEYDVAGSMTKRRRSSYNSSDNAESTCYTTDWLGRRLTVDYDCNGANAGDWDYHYDGDDIPSSTCPAASVQTGRLSHYNFNAFTRVLCYHPNGMLLSSYQWSASGWSITGARGTTLIYDLNGNVDKEFANDRPYSRTDAREIDYVYDGTLEDRIQYIRQKLTTAGSWTLVTSDTTLPTYFSYGGFKTLTYANGIKETNTRDKAYRLTSRKTDKTPNTHTNISLTYDYNGNITTYDDAGYRHLKYYTAYDALNRLRCASRDTISSCSGTEPWADRFIESFDYDKSGNRTNRRSGAFNTADDDAYTYVTDTDIIDKVTVGGTDKQMANWFDGSLSEVNNPSRVTFNYDKEVKVKLTNDNFLGNVSHFNSIFGDRHYKQSLCNARLTFYFYSPLGAGGTSHEMNLLDLFNTCASEYPRLYRTFVYAEGRPIAVIHSEVASGSTAQTDVATFWIHTDQIGTPILVTDSNATERWRWENDPFGQVDPVEYTVSGQDVNPDQDSSSGNPPKYNTCCCSGCATGCNTCTTGCSAGGCAGGASQDVVWSKSFAVTGANNIRLHFLEFDLHPGSTRTGSDYARLYKGAGNYESAKIADFTGNLGPFWGPWAGVGSSSTTVKLIADNVADSTNTRGVVVDKLEYTTATNGKFVMHLRMAGQLWDADALTSYNFHRWYRKQDGRYISPDPMGLQAGSYAYYDYAASRPLTATDRTGLCQGVVTPWEDPAVCMKLCCSGDRCSNPYTACWCQCSCAQGCSTNTEAARTCVLNCHRPLPPPPPDPPGELRCVHHTVCNPDPPPLPPPPGPPYPPYGANVTIQECMDNFKLNVALCKNLRGAARVACHAAALSILSACLRAARG